MAPFVFCKQRECEMQLVYTVQNKALSDNRTSAHWNGGATVLSFKEGGVELKDALKHVRKPSLLRTRGEEDERSRSRTRNVMECPEHSQPEPKNPPKLWTDDAAPHMLDVPMNARYVFGIVASVDDKNGEVPSDMHIGGGNVTEQWWIDVFTGKLASPTDENKQWLRQLAALGDSKLATVLFNASVCTCDTEIVQLNAVTWRDDPADSFTHDMTQRMNLQHAINEARSIIQNRYVPSEWARRVVVERQEGAADDETCVITPERYQHPAVVAHDANWFMNESRLYERVDGSKPALDLEYVWKRYGQFMASLGPRLSRVGEEPETDPNVYGTRAYQSGNYHINSLLKLARFTYGGPYTVGSRSALGPYWAQLKVEGLYASSVRAGEDPYANPASRNIFTHVDKVSRYPPDDERYACSLYTLMYHLYENPDCVGSSNPQNNPYAQTHEQWTANHTLAMVYLRNVYRVELKSQLNSDVNRVKFGELSAPADSHAQMRYEAAQLVSGHPPMAANGDRRETSPLFVMHKLLKAMYVAPRLEREIQVVRGEANFDFLCDGTADPEAPSPNMLKRDTAFQAKNLRVGQRFVAQGFTSTSMNPPYHYLLKQSTETDTEFDYVYDNGSGDVPLTGGQTFYGTTKHGGKDIPCCLHLFTLAKGMPVLPMFLSGAPDQDRPWLDKRFADEMELLLPPNCEMEFLGTTFVLRHHSSEASYMDTDFLNDTPEWKADSATHEPSDADKIDWRTSERVIAYCWFVRYRGVPRGGWLSNPGTASGEVADAIQRSEADVTADAGEYTDDEDLDWGVGTASPRTHLREHLHNKDTDHMKKFQERYGALYKKKVFADVRWPD